MFDFGIFECGFLVRFEFTVDIRVLHCLMNPSVVSVEDLFVVGTPGDLSGSESVDWD